VKVVLTDEAQRQARAESAWWRQHRDVKPPFGDELRRARSILATDALREIDGYFDGLAVRRLLPKTRCHLYYLVFEHEQVVRIVAVWGGAKGAAPGSIVPI
jgi:hypothetical protein